VTDAKAAGLQHFQDWRAWSERRLLDVVCPTADTLDAAAFAAQIGDARRAAGETPMWVAIDASRLSTSETVDRIRAARQIGARGVIIGSYGSLMSQPDGLDYLTRVAREAFEP
jgi:dihydrodipicolinate synthase/N-acetylneuraminate lyase